MNIEIHPKQIFTKLLYLIIFLLFANIIGIVSNLAFDQSRVLLFRFDSEHNIPTLYSSFALIVSSILLAFIGSAHKRLGTAYLPWIGLAIIFLFLAIDESLSIHERFVRPVRDLFKTSGLLYFAWVIPYGIALIVFLIAYLKFLLDLPKRIMILFIISGSTFVSGAIGLEMLGGRYLELHGTNNLIYSIFFTCEEFLEMLGIVIFIYTLLSYIATQITSFTVTVREK